MKAAVSTRPGSSWVMTSVVVLAGCGGGLGPVPVAGTVTLDGEPVAGAKVTFIPAGPGIPATGTTDATGRYELRIGSGRTGVPLGRYGVTVSKLKVSTITEGEARRVTAAASAEVVETESTSNGLVQVIEHVIPRRYADPATSGLEVDVISAGEQALALRTEP